MTILNQEQIKQKIKRMAIEIYEHHSEEKVVYLAGINTKGYELALLLEQEIKNLSPLKCVIMRIKVEPSAPTTYPVVLQPDNLNLENAVIIIADDVCNTGRTVFYSFKCLLDFLPKKLEVAVLVERSHKCFPVHVDIVGLKLATTINEDIEVLIGVNLN
jgi:pyrimidine operon attenuation protein / uracil phosphoribosyltransferase